MARVTVSPKFQIVIPREIRGKLRLRPGQKIHHPFHGKGRYVGRVRLNGNGANGDYLVLEFTKYRPTVSLYVPLARADRVKRASTSRR